MKSIIIGTGMSKEDRFFEELADVQILTMEIIMKLADKYGVKRDILLDDFAGAYSQEVPTTLKDMPEKFYAHMIAIKLSSENEVKALISKYKMHEDILSKGQYLEALSCTIYDSRQFLGTYDKYTNERFRNLEVPELDD